MVASTVSITLVQILLADGVIQTHNIRKTMSEIVQEEHF